MLYKFCVALLPRRLSIQLQALRDKYEGATMSSGSCAEDISDEGTLLDWTV